jgi:hypothetical protein
MPYDLKVRLALVAMVVFVAGTLVWRQTKQNNLLEDFRRTINSDVSYLMLCESSGAVSSNSCRIIDNDTSFKLSGALKHLSEAETIFMPGKGSTSSERILRFGRGSPASKQYLACYRVLHHAGSDWIYIRPVLMNADCSYVERYLAGDLGVPVHSWLGLPTAKSP